VTSAASQTKGRKRAASPNGTDDAAAREAERKEKRTAQNRQAQKAFRDRAKQHMQDLEAKSLEFDAYKAAHGDLAERLRVVEERETRLNGLGSAQEATPQQISLPSLAHFPEPFLLDHPLPKLEGLPKLCVNSSRLAF
jgi:hypothetical protein